MEVDNFFEAAPSGLTLPAEFPDNTNMDKYRIYARGTHLETTNISVAQLYNFVGGKGQSQSIRGHVDQPLPLKDVVKEILNGINQSVAKVRKQTVSFADEMFEYDWGGVPPWKIEPIAVRFPSANFWSLQASLAYGASVYALIRVDSNGVPNGLTRVSAGSIIKPLIQLKKRIIMQLFEIEVQGVATPEEITALFSQFKPTVPVGDGTISQETAEGDESSPRPSLESASNILKGTDIFTWVPSDSDWLKFDRVVADDEFVGAKQLPGYQIVQGTGTPSAA